LKGYAKAFSPAGVSGFFIPHVRDSPLVSGAQGGGIALKKGVYVEVTVEDSDRTEITTLVNGYVRDMFVARRVCERLLERVNEEYKVIVNQKIEVPMGGGFGTSGASAIATGLALARALNLKLTYLDVAREAHIVEIECGTGLGTISGLVVGGFVIVLEPGPPGLDKVDRIIVGDDYRVVLGFFKSMSKTDIIRKINLMKVYVEGYKTLKKIINNPTSKTFMDCCWEFAKNIGVTTVNTVRAVKALSKLNVVGVSQAMIGDSVFVLAYPEDVENITSILRSLGAQVVVSEISFEPAHVVK